MGRFTRTRSVFLELEWVRDALCQLHSGSGLDRDQSWPGSGKAAMHAKVLKLLSRTRKAFEDHVAREEQTNAVTNCSMGVANRGD